MDQAEPLKGSTSPQSTWLSSVARTFERVLGWVENAFAVVAGVATFAMMLVISADAIGRYLFDSPISGAREVVTRYLMVAGVWLAYAITQRHEGHVGVDLLISRTPLRAQKAAGVIGKLIGAGFAAVLAAAGYNGFIESLGASTMGVIKVPVAPSWAMVSAGSALLAVRLLVGAAQGSASVGRPPVEEAAEGAAPGGVI